MADDQLVGQGFSDYVGTRQLPGQTQTEFYNKQTNQAYGDAQQLATAVQPYAQNVNAQNVFDVLKAGTTPAATVPVPSTIPTNAVAGAPSNYDLQTIMDNNKKVRDQVFQYAAPSADEVAARTNLGTATNTLKNFDVSLEGGVQQIMKKPVALEFQQGQQTALTRDASFTRSSLAREVDSSNTTLQNIQQSRMDMLQLLDRQSQYGQQDLQTALQLDQVKKQEAQAAKDFALKYDISTPFYKIGNTVYRTSDGKGAASPEEYVQLGGNGKFNDVMDASPYNTLEQKNADRAYQLQKDQFGQDVKNSDRNYDLQKTQGDRSYAMQQAQLALDKVKFDYTTSHSGTVVGTGVIDPETGEEIKGIFDGQTLRPVSGAAANIAGVAQDGTVGGQCGDFAHTIANFPSVGDTLAQKQNTVRMSGIASAQWQKEGARPGDVLIENYGKYGHVATVVAVNNDGTVTVKESNFGNDGKIGTRTVALNDKNIYGVLRGTLKGDNTAQKTNSVNPQLQAFAQQYASDGKVPSGLKGNQFSIVADLAKSIPKPTGSIIDNNTGVKPAKLSDTQIEGISSLYDIVNNKIPSLLQSYQKIDKSIIGRLGSVAYTTQDRQNFRTAKQEILNLLLKARSGAAVNDAEYARYVKMLPSETSLTGSTNQINSLQKSLTDTLGSKLSVNGVSIYGYSQVKINGKSYKVGDILDNGNQKARVNADGSLSAI